MLYFIAVSNSSLYMTGFVVDKGNSHKVTIDIRKATPYTSFKDADEAAKKLGLECYAILSNCIG